MCSRSDWRYGPCAPPTSAPSSQSRPSQRRSSIADPSASFVERATSVSSMRRTNVPPAPRASSQLKSAVRALPTCSCPVGLGAKRTRITGSEVIVRRDRESARPRGRRSPRRARSESTPSLVLPLTLTCGGVDAERARQVRAHRVDVRRELRPLRDDDDVDVADRVAGARDDRHGARCSSSRLFAPFHAGSVSGK